jgi:uncharacterized protein
MSQANNTGLTDQQRLFICATLAPYAGEIERVGIFGSRATGRYKPESDIDLVLYGPVAQANIDRLWTTFEEGSLPFRVDILAYQLITHGPLRQHIDNAVQTFLDKEDLAFALLNLEGKTK